MSIDLDDARPSQQPYTGKTEPRQRKALIALAVNIADLTKPCYHASMNRFNTPVI